AGANLGDVLELRVETIQVLEEQLAAVDSRSTLFTWIRDAADEAGLVFGWGTVYLTLFLALWGGRTPGKKLLGLRVVRLNGQPLGLLMSLERAGGYAAGFATGLLGFARVWWDPNRQGIHDKIAETVVIREGQPNLLYREGAAEAPGPNDIEELAR
ncbi:MAG: RDD family protein, partial [Gemmatimonadetes bacterium]|nr:RDD family protein [Gemmatimonadota bacterium]